MANMNPLRDDELAARERVIQLERELAEKDKLIYKLQNPKPKKPKKPRKPINWPVWFKKTAKISSIILGCSAVLSFCTFIVEPDDIYVAKGKILRILDVHQIYKKSCKKPDKNSMLVDAKGPACGQNTPDIMSFVLRVKFNDKYHGERTLDISHKIQYAEFTISKPFIGCTIDVYYALGQIFKDRPWVQNSANTSLPKNHVDTSMCGKQKPGPKKPAQKNTKITTQITGFE